MKDLEHAGNFAGEYTSAIRQALSLDPAERPTPAEMKQALEDAPGVGSPTAPVHLPAFAETRTQKPAPFAAPTTPQDALPAADAAKKPKRRTWALIGVGAALLAVVVATSLITQTLTSRAAASDAAALVAAASASAEAEAAAAAAAETAPAETVFVTVTPTGEETAAPRDSDRTASPSAPAAAGADIDRFEIAVGTPNGHTVGERVGDNKFQVSENQGEVTVVYGWTAISSAGLENTSETCNITTTISGPEFQSGVLSDDCAVGGVSFFSASDRMLRITTPGDYTVTVTNTDSQTGASVSSSETFTVVGR
ncbi:hypothetical protein [Pseudoclavibacter helvolus]|uniref:hypothetical protein n=1 Tax=Pseudoclavibacter helvolus TaxID=255205 RepID=UPI0008389C3D|nr:hypothetical protein [Pseudoclavibacter helvolus]